MDYRRNYGLRAARPIGYSTFMVPQLENYSLFASPFLDPDKRLRELIAQMKKPKADQSEKDIEVKVKRNEEVQTKEKCEEDKQREFPNDEEVDAYFGIILNVVTAKPEDITITFGEGNEVEVNVNQSDVKLDRMEITFSRNCSYKYQLPDGIDKKSLVALRTSDDYLIILPRDLLREDIFFKSIKGAKELIGSSDKDVASSMEATESADPEKKETKSKGSKSEEREPKGSETKEKGKTTEKSKLDENEVKASDEEPKPEIFLNENGLVPLEVSRMLRPGMDIFMLRKYIVDFESYVSTVRKYIENASFISLNSKTPEIGIRNLALQLTDLKLEARNISDKKKKKISKDPSAESGYTSSEKFTPNDTDESSRSSSTKSVELSRETPED